MAASPYSWRQVLAGVVALGVTIACGVYMRRTWREAGRKPARPPLSIVEQLRRVPAGGAGGARSDAATVCDWRLSTRPLLAPTDAPGLVWRHSTETPIFLPASPKGKARRIHDLKPAVAVDVEVLLSPADGGIPAVWPGLAKVRLLRGEAPEGPFASVLDAPREDADRLTPERYESLEAGETRYGYRLSLLDAQPGAAGPRVYKVQMLAAGGEILEESGVCTGWALALPKVEAKRDSAGLLTLSWPAPELPADAFVEPPRLVVGVTDAHQHLAIDPAVGCGCELGRFPAAPGRFTLPFALGAAGSAAGVARVALVGRLRCQAWSQSQGAYETVLPAGIGDLVTDRPGLAADSAIRRQARFRGSLLPSVPEAYSFHPGSRREAFLLRCEVPPFMRATAMDIRHLGTGTTETLPKVGTAEYPQVAGLGERLVYALAASDGQRQATLTASGFSPPMPSGLRVVSAGDAIRLVWAPLTVVPEDWVEEPRFVVRRLAASEVSQGYGGNLVWPRAFAEVGRVPCSATEFTDRAVVPGAEYFYALDLEGVAKGTGAVGDTSDIPVNIPVCCGTGSQGGPQPLLARAELSGPVRLAVHVPTGRALAADAAREALEAGLRREPWLQLVDRANVTALLDEAQLARTLADQTGPSAVAQAADLIVFCIEGRTAAGSHYDVSLTDARQGRRESLGSWPAQDTPWAEVIETVVTQAKTRFPDWEQRAARAAAPAAASAPVTLAVLDPQPVLAECDEALPPGALQALLVVALTEAGNCDVVDRERLKAVIDEHGLSGAVGDAGSLELGRLAKADALVTGTYRLRQGQVSLTVRFAAVSDGRHLATVDVQGSKDDLEGIARQVAARTTALGLASVAAGGGSNAQRVLEAMAGTGGYDRLAAAKAAAFVGIPNPEALADLGQEYEQKGQLEEALNCYHRALDLADQNRLGSHAPLWCQEPADALLRKLNRPQDRVRLWQRALARLGPDGRGSVSAVRLAEAQYDAGDKEGARATLRRAGVRPDDPQVGALLEKLGGAEEAVEALLAATWFGRSGLRPLEGAALQPAYAGAIRALARVGPDQRRQILAAIVTNLGAERPIQALQATAELRRLGPLPTELLHYALGAALAAADRETSAALVQELTTRSPPDLALLKALAASFDLLRRHGRTEEATALAKRALGLPVKGGAADVARALVERRLKDLGKDAGTRAAAPALSPGIDEDLWQHLADRGGRATAPDSDLYVLTETGFVLRLSEADRRVVWQYDLAFRQPFPRPDPDGRGRTLRVADQGFWLTQEAVYACNFVDGVVHAIDTATGKRLWTHTEWTAVSPPLVRPQHDICVCVANSFGELVILSAKDGSLVRRVPAPEVLHERYCEALPELTVIHDNEAGGEVHWTDWLQLGPSGGWGFAKRNYATQRGDARGLVHIDANHEGTHAYNLATGEVKITDLRLKGAPAEAWREAVAARGATARDRARAVGAAGELADREQSLPTLLKILKDPNEDSDVRAETIESILESGQEEGFDAVIDALSDADGHVRMEALRALYNSKMAGGHIPPSALGRLAQLAHGQDSLVARPALHCLLSLGGIETKPLIQDLLDGPESERRTGVALALAEAGDKAMVPLILPLLRDDLPAEKQMGILRILSALGEPKARDLYLGTIDTAQWLAKAAEVTQRGPTSREVHEAKALVSSIGPYAPDERLVPFLEEFSKHYQGKLRADICRALGQIGSARSVPFLIAMLPPAGGPPFAGTWEAGAGPVTSALTQITGQNCGEKREDWQAWWDAHRTEFANPGQPPAAPGAQDPPR